MKAIQYRAYGGYQENRVVELERPQPKDGEVLVEMRAADALLLQLRNGGLCRESG